MTQFSDYDRVVDTLLYLSDNITFDFVVVLSTKDKAGNRSFFHSETEYESNKYSDVSMGKGIKRKMIFYFVINNKQYFDGGFILRPQDVQMLIMLIEQTILPWYFDHHRRIFSIIDNKLVITGKYNPVEYIRNEYQYLQFVPNVYTFENDTYKEGIRMYINSSNSFVDMEIDKFMGLYYILKNTDMYGVATGLTTYVKTAPYDINVWKKYGLAGAYNSSQDDTVWNNVLSKEINKQSSSGNNFFKNSKKKEE